MANVLPPVAQPRTVPARPATPAAPATQAHNVPATPRKSKTLFASMPRYFLGFFIGAAAPRSVRRVERLDLGPLRGSSAHPPVEPALSLHRSRMNGASSECRISDRKSVV